MLYKIIYTVDTRAALRLGQYKQYTYICTRKICYLYDNINISSTLTIIIIIMKYLYFLCAKNYLNLITTNTKYFSNNDQFEIHQA